MDSTCELFNILQIAQVGVDRPNSQRMREPIPRCLDRDKRLGLRLGLPVRVSELILPLEPGYLTINVAKDNWTLLATPNPSLMSHDHAHIMRRSRIGSHICCAVDLSIQVDPVYVMWQVL